MKCDAMRSRERKKSNQHEKFSHKIVNFVNYERFFSVGMFDFVTATVEFKNLCVYKCVYNDFKAH